MSGNYVVDAFIRTCKTDFTNKSNFKKSGTNEGNILSK